MNEWDSLYVYSPSQLMSAALNGDVAVLRDLLKNGKRTDSVDHRGWTPLHAAASTNQLECLKALLQNKRTNILARCLTGFTAAEIAVLHNASLPVVRLLFTKGGRQCMRADMLHIACFKGALDVVEYLVTSGADVNIHEELNMQTPLHRAAEGKKPDVIKYLLSKGAEVNGNDISSCTPLFEAVQQGSVECAEILLEAGAKPNQRAHDGVTPLMMACQKGNIGIVNLLLSKGAKPNLVAKDYSTAFTYAVDGGWVNIVRLLLPLLCSKSLTQAASSPSAGSVSLYCIAIDSESDECLSLLLEAGLPDELKTWPLQRKLRDLQPHARYTKCSPMSFLLRDKMSEYGDRTVAVLEKLINSGFPVNVSRKSELPPLVAALLFPLLQHPSGQQACLERLIEAGANVDYRSISSNKLPDAILAACLKCNGPALKTLLPFSAVCPHQLLEHFIAGRSTVFCYFIMAEASLGDDFSGLEAIVVSTLVDSNKPRCVWRSFLPRLREKFPSLQAMCRRKVRECLRTHSTDTKEFLQCIESLNVPSLIKSYLRFKL